MAEINIRHRFERLSHHVGILEKKLELIEKIRNIDVTVDILLAAQAANHTRIEEADETIEGNKKIEETGSLENTYLPQIGESEQCHFQASILDLPCPILQEIYGWAPEYVCTHTAVCKWFNEVLPEAKMIQLRVLRGRGVSEDYMKRFSGKNQRIWLVVRDYNISFDLCVMRALISVFESTIANVVTLDFTGMLHEKFPTTENIDGTEKAQNRIGFYITGLVKHATNLERLILKQNNFSDQMGTMIAAGLSERSGLKEIDLSFNRFHNFAVIALASSIFRNTRLERISLAGNDICENAMEAVSVAIEACPYLTDLDVGGQGRYISTFLPCLIWNTRIRCFSAAARDEQWSALKAVMVLSQCHCQLVSLDLSCGSLGTQGCNYLARALRRLTRLERLALCACNITEAGSRLLAGADAAPSEPFAQAESAGGRASGIFAAALLRAHGDDPFSDVLPECLTRLAALHSHNPEAIRTMHDSAAAGLTRLRTLNLSRNAGPHPRTPVYDCPKGGFNAKRALPPPPQPVTSRCTAGPAAGGRVGRGRTLVAGRPDGTHDQSGRAAPRRLPRRARMARPRGRGAVAGVGSGDATSEWSSAFVCCCCRRRRCAVLRKDNSQRSGFPSPLPPTALLSAPPPPPSSSPPPLPRPPPPRPPPIVFLSSHAFLPF